MSPYETAKAMYKDGELGKIIDKCAANGLVHSDSSVFLCAYTTHSSLILGTEKKEVDNADTWYIYIASGNISDFFKLNNPEMKYVAFRRKNKKIKLVEIKAIQRRISYGYV